ncbi:MAG: hypothetical protein HDS87_05120 [Bacteroidales bacterium]|nr:hypothetical protein [Bacteroidales bacterium]
MYIDDLTDAIAHCAEAKGWNVEGKTDYKQQSTEFEFSKFSPAGQDFIFNATLKNADFSTFINELEDFYEDYDVDYETYIWLDEFGHGKNGAPYRLRDVLDDMEATEKMIEELLDSIRNLELPEPYSLCYL